MLHRIAAALLVSLGILGFGLSATAGNVYPDHPIRLLVGFGAGGPTDIPARFIANQLSDSLGQRVVVENRPVAAGMLATRDVIARPPDGYTLLLCTHFDPINVAMYSDAGFKLGDLAPISLIAEYYYGLALSNEVPANNFESFIEYAKSRPGDITYATIGIGSAQEIIARQLEKLAGIEMKRIPFRSGPQVVEEIVSGLVDLYVSPTLAIVPQYQAKKLKILATTGPMRLKNLSEIPTVKEKGIDFVRFGWLGICARAGTPAPIIQTLHDKIVPIVSSADYHTLVENGGSIAISSTPQELGSLMQKTLDDAESSVQSFGLKQEQ